MCSEKGKHNNKFGWYKFYIDTDGRDEFSNEVKLNLILFKQMTIIIQW